MTPTPWREPATASLEVWRCPRCGRILAKLRISEGSRIEVKCRSCNTYATKER